MADKEWKKYNSDFRSDGFNIRLTDDAEVLGENFVKFTFAAESANEGDETMWIDVIPLDQQAPIASFLKKGDVVSVTGRLTMQKWGDNRDKVSFTLRGAYLHLDPSFIAELKERGFVPGTKSVTKSGGKGKAAKPPAKAAGRGRRPVVNLDDDEE